MKLLQKILFVAMVGVFVGNADVRGLQFSDPRLGPPALTVNPGGGIPNGNYVDFAAGAHHIYFPHSGVQPDVAHIGQLACAGIADTGHGTPGRAITDWYVRAFGGDVGVELSYGRAVPGVDHALQMGFTVPPVAAAHIISSNMGALNLNQEFWQEFRTIASTVAGRELLYRILIEIRRIDTVHANQHCYASGTERVGGMSLIVTHHAGNTAFVNKGSMTFDNAHRVQLRGVLEQYYSFLTTLVDFPALTPHFAAENVIGIPNAVNPSDQFTHIQIGGNNIYFPIDGEQPSVVEVENFSCYTIDEDDANSPITDWYITMFGGPDHTNHNPNLQMGFIAMAAGVPLARPAIAAIIAMDANMGIGTRTTDFWQDFRRIASSRIGRILLYRILIEIRRQRNIGGWQSYVSTDVPGITSAANLKGRANCRSITVSWEVRGNSFSKDGHTIKYANTNRKLTTICEKMGNSHPISPVERESHIGLFHEMVHWFHVLRHPERHSKERMAFKAPAISLRDTANRETIGGYFWGGIDNNNTNSWKVSATPWLGYSINDSYVNFEEIRTILGAPTLVQYRLVVPNNPLHPNPYVFLNGDDLSENKYRVSIGAKLRFGHSNQPFYEDNSVIQKVIDVSGAAGGNIVNLVDYNALDDGCRPECKIGLGNFRVGGYNIDGMIP